MMEFLQSFFICVLTLPFPYIEATEEDDFVKTFGNDPTTPLEWDVVQRYPISSNHLEINCAEIHQKLLKRMIGIDINVDIDDEICAGQATLLFHNAKYMPMKIDVIRYSIKGPLRSDSDEKVYHHITRGQRPNCVYYLSLSDREWYFYLDIHVCDDDPVALYSDDDDDDDDDEEN